MGAGAAIAASAPAHHDGSRQRPHHLLRISHALEAELRVEPVRIPGSDRFEISQCLDARDVVDGWG
jgi:hypothetical protein